LYVDNEIGAGATGVGENIMILRNVSGRRAMRSGTHPEEACAETIGGSKEASGRHGPEHQFLAVDKRGRYGAAGTDKGFDFAVAYPGFSRVLKSAAVPPRI
jgi:N4-(beta-N-acetylglucosaminyl)-L-asparaginase